MKKNTLLVILVSLAQLSIAHEGKDHQHSELTPIPAYNNSLGKASAESATTKITAFIDTLDAKNKPLRPSGK